MDKNVYIHFVDKRDFKEVSIVGKRKSKKKCALGFVLTAVSMESSSKDNEVEVDCSSEIESSRPDKNSNESTEESTCRPGEFSENEETSKMLKNEATGSCKPTASPSKKTTQM